MSLTMRDRAVVLARQPAKNSRVLVDELDTELRKRIGGRLKALRIQAHLHQLEVAKQAGISTGTLQTIEWGVRKNRPESIAKVARVFGTSIDVLAAKEHIAPTDPVLRELNREDFDIARAYNKASSTVRHYVQQLLRDRDPRELPAPTGEAAAREARIASLTPARQQLVDDLIHELLHKLDQRDEDIG